MLRCKQIRFRQPSPMCIAQYSFVTTMADFGSKCTIGRMALSKRRRCSIRAECSGRSSSLLSAGDLRISRFDSSGRYLQIQAVSPAGFLSSRGTDSVTTFEYDLHGNEIEMNTTASDGTLQRRTTNSYRFDEKGNWTEQTVVDLDQTWQTKPFPASFEEIWRFTRKLDYCDA